jgi:hypothetical protein
VDEPTGSTNLPGVNSDGRRLAPKRAARRGEAQDEPSNPNPAPCGLAQRVVNSELLDLWFLRKL